MCRPAGARCGLSIPYPQLALWATTISSASPAGGLLNSITNHGRRSHNGPLIHLRHSLARPTDALPLDLFRVLVGLVAFLYFLQTLLEARDFSGPDGLIDHELSQKIFWFTRIGLFHSGLSLSFFQTLFVIACLCSWAVILGYRVKIFAAILYLIAVSTYRWNFLVMYVDDSIMHLALFWVLLLPVGRTLVLSEWRADRKKAWQRWKHATVPGVAVRCLFWNFSLIYLVAGLWKWTSPMWRDGTALYAIFKLPISLSPDFWGPQHLPLLKLLNYSALVFEPLFPLIFVLPRGHRLKYALLLALLGFHIGTLVTLRIPFANLACCAVLVIPFGGELMHRLRRGPSESIALQSTPRLGLCGVVALVLVVALTLAMVSSVTLPQWRMPSRSYYAKVLVAQDARALSVADNVLDTRSGRLDKFSDEGLGPLQWTFFSFLWCMGIAQQYQLFNWIDDRNYSLHYEVIEYQDDKPARQVEPDAMFPGSTHGVLLQFYLHGITWMRIPPERQAELRSSLQVRFAGRYCQQFQPRGDVAVYSTLERIIPGANRVEENRVLFMRFSCQGSEPRMQAMNLDP
jgi:hypothetical protein